MCQYARYWSHLIGHEGAGSILSLLVKSDPFLNRFLDYADGKCQQQGLSLAVLRFIAARSVFAVRHVLETRRLPRSGRRAGRTSCRQARAAHPFFLWSAMIKQIPFHTRLRACGRRTPRSCCAESGGTVEHFRPAWAAGACMVQDEKKRVKLLAGESRMHSNFAIFMCDIGLTQAGAWSDF